MACSDFLSLISQLWNLFFFSFNFFIIVIFMELMKWTSAQACIIVLLAWKLSVFSLVCKTCKIDIVYLIKCKSICLSYRLCLDGVKK